MDSVTMTINGTGASSNKTFPVINPALGESFAQAPECSPEQVNAAMEAAQNAFVSWQQDEPARRQALRTCARVLRENTDELGTLFAREHGRPLTASKDEVGWMARDLENFAGMEIPCEVIQDDDEVRTEIHRRPFGVVAAIVPWNFPLLIAGWKIGQALLTGNTIVVKPSPFTPLATLRVGELLRDVLPPGVLNVISGGSEVGAAMIEHPIPRKVTFTGSIATGKKIAQSAGADLKAVTLELGGNDAAIVLPDMDPGAIAEQIFWNAFFNTGQTCVAIKRLYVHEDIYPQMVEALAAQVGRVKVGDGFDPTSGLGPMNNQMQFNRVIDLVEDAKRHGARMVTGGTARDGHGYFFEPTLVTGISDGTRLVDEEQFGPALPIMPYRRVEDALERANATHYGLGGSIWTKDLERGYELASRLECGTSWINHHMGATPMIQPQSGAKWSGIGNELGEIGLTAYTRVHVVRTLKH
ncbi:MAG: aldehyde dehydrogenase family protein [Anaerolineae bacterium]|nr:aldehyde dehydrogenase family protein [Anaerolineae bacterium]